MEAAQIDALFSRARIVLAVNVVNALITAFFLRNAVPSASIAAWLLSILLISAARFKFLLEYEKMPAKPLAYWKLVAVSGSALSGVAWGMATMFPAQSLHLQIFLPVVMMGMMAGSAVSWHAYFPAFKAYFLPVALITSIDFADAILSGGAGLFITLGAMFLIFSVGIYLLAWHSNRILLQSLARSDIRSEGDLQRALSAMIFRSGAEAIMVMDEDKRVVEVNPAFTRITGYEAEEVVGSPFRMFQTDEYLDEVWRTVQDEGRWEGEIWSCRKDGELYAQRTRVSLLRHSEGQRFLVQFSDLTEGKKKEEIIWLKGNFDALTNLPNRRLFHERLDGAAASRFTLFFIDLDRFREINDTLGYETGDLLLVEAAHRIRKCLPESGMVARLGGDEFAVMVPAPVKPDVVAKRVLNELRKPFRLDEETLHVSASIGLTSYPDDAENMEDLLRHADQAMYDAKAKGGDRFEYFTMAMQQEAVEKINLVRDLRMALERGELQVHYQPIVEMSSGRIVKAEALLRWKHSERGMIGPDLFVPLAEQSGLIIEIGEWLFREVAFRAREWQGKFSSPIALSINKSPLQFDEQPLEWNWLNLLEEFGLPRNSIAIEITEGLLLRESASTKKRLLAFHEGGIEISIDDFGTGFSSLSYLKQFEVDYLKIDRSFISGLTENGRDMAITEAIIAMGHKLGLKVIAEGVETAIQRDLLESFGCDFAQGFLYSPPLPLREFEHLLETAKSMALCSGGQVDGDFRD